MIQCPKCSNSLPDWAQVCQFCSADLKGVARPVPTASAGPQSRPYTGPAKWIWPTYYAISGYYILDGLRMILIAVLRITSIHKAAATGSSAVVMAGDTLTSFQYVDIVVGAITIFIGIGLILRLEFVRGIVNFFCFINIVLGVLRLGSTILIGSLLGPIVLLLLFLNVLSIASSALMIYLIGETD